MKFIYHITPAKAWQETPTGGAFTTESLNVEGFIHASTAEQLVATANRMFAGQERLILLAVDEDRLDVPVRYEDLYDAGEKFPHIYGPINADAVLAAIPFPPDGDGTFRLPPMVQYLDAPLLEHDPTPRALIEPDEHLAPIDIPERCVLCFFQEVLTSLIDTGRLRQIYELRSEIGPNYVYELEIDGERVAVCHPGVGAPMAGAFLDELIALGCNRFIACGGAGVLDGNIAVGHLVVPTSALRDEGTSYHYLPPAREVPASADGIRALQTVMQRDDVPFVMGKTWTTDGIYRETPDKIRRRHAEGCLTVEMEAATFFAVAQFRRVTFGMVLYGGDDVSSDTWDSRHWQKRTSVREKLFWLAAEAALEL